MYSFLSYMFISILYMFRAPMCSSSGESVVSIQHMVCHSMQVTFLYAGLDGTPRNSIQTCTPDGHLHRVTYTRCRIDTTDSPDDEHMGARNMQRFETNIYEHKMCIKLVTYKSQTLHLMQKYLNAKIAHLFHVHLRSGKCTNKADIANTSVSDYPFGTRVSHLNFSTPCM